MGSLMNNMTGAGIAVTPEEEQMDKTNLTVDIKSKKEKVVR
jgi:hypothetical protein